TYHRDPDDRLQGGYHPVSVGKQRGAGERAVPDLAERVPAPVDVRLRPAGVAGVAEQFGRVDELEALQGRAELPVRAGDRLEARGPGVQDVAGLVGVPDVARDAPHQRVLVCRAGIADRLGHEVGRSATPRGDVAGVADHIVVRRS